MNGPPPREMPGSPGWRGDTQTRDILRLPLRKTLCSLTSDFEQSEWVWETWASVPALLSYGFQKAGLQKALLILKFRGGFGWMWDQGREERSR